MSGWGWGIAIILGSGVTVIVVMGWQAGRGARWCGIIVHSSAAPGEEGLSGRGCLGWAAHIMLVKAGSLVAGSCFAQLITGTSGASEVCWGGRVWAQMMGEIRLISWRDDGSRGEGRQAIRSDRLAAQHTQYGMSILLLNSHHKV